LLAAPGAEPWSAAALAAEKLALQRRCGGIGRFESQRTTWLKSEIAAAEVALNPKETGGAWSRSPLGSSDVLLNRK
jgi:hypothetical protein